MKLKTDFELEKTFEKLGAVYPCLYKIHVYVYLVRHEQWAHVAVFDSAIFKVSDAADYVRLAKRRKRAGRFLVVAALDDAEGKPIRLDANTGEPIKLLEKLRAEFAA